MPAAVKDATEEYIGDNDVLGRFITECTESKFGAKTKSHDAYLAYSEWCFGQSETPQDEKFFGRAMEERGTTKKRTNSGMVFENLALKGTTNAPIFNGRVDIVEPKHRF